MKVLYAYWAISSLVQVVFDGSFHDLCVSGPSVPPVWCVSTGRPERLPAGAALPALLLQSMLGAALHCSGQRWHGSGWVEGVCVCVVIKAGIRVCESRFVFDVSSQVSVHVCVSAQSFVTGLASDPFGKCIWAYVVLPYQQRWQTESLDEPNFNDRKHYRSPLDACAQVHICLRVCRIKEWLVTLKIRQV